MFKLNGYCAPYTRNTRFWSYTQAINWLRRPLVHYYLWRYEKW